MVDHASAVWSHKVSAISLRLAQQVNRIGACTIIAGFSTVSREVAEAEAALWPVEYLWDQQRRRFWIDLHTLPRTNPFWKIQTTFRTKSKRFPSPFYHLA